MKILSYNQFLFEKQNDELPEVAQAREKAVEYYLNHFQNPATIFKLGGMDISKEIVDFIRNVVSIIPYDNFKDFSRKNGGADPMAFAYTYKLDSRNHPKNTITLNLELIKNKNNPLDNVLVHEIGHAIDNYIRDKYKIKTVSEKPPKTGMERGFFVSDVNKFRNDLWVTRPLENFSRMQILRRSLEIPVKTTTAELFDKICDAIESGKIKIDTDKVIMKKIPSENSITFTSKNPIRGGKKSRKRLSPSDLWGIYSGFIISEFLGAKTSETAGAVGDIGAIFAYCSDYDKDTNTIKLDVSLMSDLNNETVKGKGKPQSYA